MADVFLSYKKRDRELVESLAKALTAEGFTVWWDYEIETGDDWLKRILVEVAVARCLVGVWTRSSVDADGMFIPGEDGTSYVRIEHERAGIAKIAGALFDRRAVPVTYSAAQFADLSDWTPGDRRHEGFRGLVSYLEKKAMPAFAARRVAVRGGGPAGAGGGGDRTGAGGDLGGAVPGGDARGGGAAAVAGGRGEAAAGGGGVGGP